MTPTPNTSPQTAPETQVSGRRSASPAREVVLATLRKHADYTIELDDQTDVRTDLCQCGTELACSRGLTLGEALAEHQADAIITALLAEVLA